MVKPRYERRGQCIRCGFCCQQENCEHLSFDEDGLATCLIHEEERPLRCSLYPANPPIVHEGCGYWFIDLYENNKIVKRKL
jgi:hypothetical protein